MPSTVKADDFRILNPGADACTNMQQLLQSNDKFRTFLQYMLDSSGYPSDTFAGELSDLLFPVGFIAMDASTVARSDKWLSCNGQAVLRANYPDLFAAIGTTWTLPATGVLEFNVPDFRDRSPVGVSGTRAIGSKEGEAQLKLTGANVPSHSHDIAIKIPNRGNDTTFDGPLDKGGGLDQGTFDSVAGSGVTNNVTRFPLATIHSQVQAICDPNIPADQAPAPFNNYHPVNATLFYIRAKK